MKQNRKGISLIVLVITIIVIIILAGAVILSLSNNNPINSGNEAVFKSDLKAFESDLSMYLTEKYVSTTGSYNPESLKADDLTAEYNGVIIPGVTIKNIIPILSTTNKYNGQLEIVNGRLVYKGTDIPKKRWAEQINLEVVNGDRLNAIISTLIYLPISAGTDALCTVKISSNSSIDSINLVGNLQLLDVNSVPVVPQPIFTIAAPTGSDTDTLRDVDITINTTTLAEGTYKLKLKARCISNIYGITNESDVETGSLFEIDNTPPTNPTMVATPTAITNGNVTLTINYATDAVTKQYSTNGTTWFTYTTPVVVTTNSTTVYAKAIDISGNQSGQSTITIANIDKIPPIVAFGTNGAINVQIASTTVTVTDLGPSNINLSTLQYVWDTQNITTPVSGWAVFTNGTAITKTGVTGTYYLWIKGSDNIGNSVVAKSNAFGTDVTPPTNPTMAASPSGWTNGNVTVTINYPVDATIKEYSTNGTTWGNYTVPVVVTTNNTTVYTRATDASGNQSGQSTLTVANIDKTAPNITEAISGSSLYDDSKFASGINSTYVYNNFGNGVVTNTRVAMADSPTGSGYGLMIKTTAVATPGWGGFFFATSSSPGKVFITKIIAKIPVGCDINWGSNLFGDGGTIMWLTSQAGTGAWQEYVCKVSCGTTGTFSTTNFYYLTGGPTPTSALPLTWNVAYATVFDTTKWGVSNGIMVNATDESGIVGYGINQSSVTAPTFTSCTPTTNFATVFDNITSNGVYYVWLKDQAGNIRNKDVTVSYIRSIPVAKFSFNSSIINEMTSKSYVGTGTSYVAGKIGNGISITNGQIEVPLSDLGITAATNIVTTSFWFKWNGDDGIMPIGFRIYDAWITGGYFGFNTAQGDVYGINNPFTIGVYTHVVLIFNKNDYNLNSIYINGVKQILSQKQGAQSNVNSVFEGNLNISGWDSSDGYFWAGSSMDELKVYNKALTDSEILLIMNE